MSRSSLTKHSLEPMPPKDRRFWLQNNNYTADNMRYAVLFVKRHGHAGMQEWLGKAPVDLKRAFGVS
jgi:hypothetical protein